MESCVFSDYFLIGLENLRIFELSGRLHAFCRLLVSGGIEGFCFKGFMVLSARGSVGDSQAFRAPKGGSEQDS